MLNHCSTQWKVKARIQISAQRRNFWLSPSLKILDDGKAEISLLALFTIISSALLLYQNDGLWNTCTPKMIESMLAASIAGIWFSNAQAATTHATEKAIVDILHPDPSTTNNRVKDASFRVVENVFMEMSHQRALDSFFKRPFDSWTLPSSIMSIFAQHAINSKTFTYLAA